MYYSLRHMVLEPVNTDKLDHKKVFEIHTSCAACTHDNQQSEVSKDSDAPVRATIPPDLADMKVFEHDVREDAEKNMHAKELVK